MTEEQAIQTVDVTLTHSELIKLLNDLQARLVEKAGYMPFKQEFKILHWINMQLLRYPDKQPQHLDDLDRYYIKNLRLAGYSTEEVGFITDRSVKTVHDYLNS